MRVFRHGDSLAIVLPPSIKSSSGISENDDYEFYEVEPGVFLLVSQKKAAEMVQQSVVSKVVLAAMAPEKHGQPAQQASVPFKSKPADYPDAPGFVSASDLSRMGPSTGAAARDVLGPQGYAVLSEADAKTASKALETEISQGGVFGVRGFDNKFYVITRGEFDAASEKILSTVQKGVEINPAQLAAALKTEEARLLCALHVLKEQGEALEKRKGVFMLLG